MTGEHATISDVVNQLNIKDAIKLPFFTDKEIHEWIDTLTTGSTADGWRRCRDKNERVEVVKDLLAHASKDDMTEVDRSICIRALEILGAPTVNAETAYMMSREDVWE